MDAICWFFIIDFGWTHRFYHETRFYGNFMQYTIQQSIWIGQVVFVAIRWNNPRACVCLLTAGFSPELTGAFAIAQLLLGLFLHANVSWRLKWLHKIVITPEFHHWHQPMREMRFGLITRHSYLFGTSSLALILQRSQTTSIWRIRPRWYKQLKYPLVGMPKPWWFLLHPIKTIKM